MNKELKAVRRQLFVCEMVVPLFQLKQSVRTPCSPHAAAKTGPGTARRSTTWSFIILHASDVSRESKAKIVSMLDGVKGGEGCN
jgi:hypothetical protein